MSVLFGIDMLVQAGFAPLDGARVGLFTNLSAVDGTLTPTYRRFVTGDVDLRALFSPEHGLAGSVADGVAVADSRDAATGIPVYSLYGDTYAPTPNMLADLDVIVCDIQDIGVRYYTYLWTVTHILEACGAADVAVMILDRPNPLGGRIDGGGLSDEISTIVGRYDIPVQHGMTLGELARMINDEFNPTRTALSVIACQGWDHAMTWPDVERPFVPPSPAMPRYVTAAHYPGACLLEGTTLSEGRGTATPFEVVGAPYIEGFALADALNALSLPGAIARPHQFTPTVSKYAGENCGGVQLHIPDAAAYRPLRAWLQVIGTVRQLYPEGFGWLPSHKGRYHFDRLIGNTQTREQIDVGAPLDDITASWQVFGAGFSRMQAPYLLYE